MTIQENTSKINEEWKDINGYEGIYQVSNLGEVRGLNRKDSLGRDVRSKILKSSYDRDGYQVISLRKDNKKSTLKIHRLVADAFIPNPHAYPQVNHKDENKENNYVSNLEWCTAKYNSNYGNRTKNSIANNNYKSESRRRALSRTHESNKKPIYGFKGDRIIWFPSVLNAIKFMNNLTGKNVTNISNTLSGKNHTCFGWNFKYAEEVEKSGKNT